MKYLVLVLMLALPASAATKCKACAKSRQEIVKLERMIVALSRPTPYKVQKFEDARVRIRYYPDGTFEYEVKPQGVRVLVITTTTHRRFWPDKNKITVKVLDNTGNEIKTNVTLIEGK